MKHTHKAAGSDMTRSGDGDVSNDVGGRHVVPEAAYFLGMDGVWTMDLDGSFDMIYLAYYLHLVDGMLG